MDHKAPKWIDARKELLVACLAFLVSQGLPAAAFYCLGAGWWWPGGLLLAASLPLTTLGLFGAGRSLLVLACVGWGSKACRAGTPVTEGPFRVVPGTHWYADAWHQGWMTAYVAGGGDLVRLTQELGLPKQVEANEVIGAE